jgi:GNAT superfamily N-acetyltransferase
MLLQRRVLSQCRVLISLRDQVKETLTNGSNKSFEAKILVQPMGDLWLSVGSSVGSIYTSCGYTRGRPRRQAKTAAIPRYTVIDNVSTSGRKRRQLAGRVPGVDDLHGLLVACGSPCDFAEILGGPSTLGDRPLDTRRLSERLESAMHGSAVVVIAYEDNMTLVRGVSFGGVPGKIVGMGRAVTDGSLVATVHDVLVHPEYRRRGVGTRILHLLCRYLDTNMDVIDVGTTCYRQRTKEFLGKAGFGDDEEGSTAMRFVEFC